MAQKRGSGSMSVSSAGQKGGRATSEKYGPDFYHKIGQKGGRVGGKKGGQRDRDLLQKGKRTESP